MVTLERRTPFLTLNQALVADAAITGAAGLVSLAGARWLDSLLDLPTALLVGSGAIMTVYAAALVALGSRQRIPATGVRSVIGVNLAWAVASAVLLLSPWIDPNALGVAFILVQIVAVLGFAELQAIALRAPR